MIPRACDGLMPVTPRAYRTRLEQLDRDIQQSLASVTNRVIVTYHDAFPVFRAALWIGNRRALSSKCPK